MIQINLLQQTQASKGFRKATDKPATAGRGASRGGAILIWATALVMVLLNASAGWMAWRQIDVARSNCDAVKVKMDSLNKQIKNRLDKADQVRKFREVLANQMDVLRSLDPADRILWSEKINMLANLIPANVFVSEVEVRENVEMVETTQSKAAHVQWEKADQKKRGKEPPVVKKPVIQYEMNLTGLALGEDNVEQFNNVLKFHSALSNYSISDGRGGQRKFMDGFNPTIELGGPIEAAVYEGAPVNQFHFKLTTLKKGSEENNSQETKSQGTQVAAGVGR